ncbi:hypothetical protein ACRYCC_14135 [Actinomadura scrupuli]|uniref:hypothetical protein n=1 Tax=Actinomadura scrupuli TaxID=559629 RepID=UPI003D961377
MPFTEEELRAVLEDNSAEVPPVSDLTGNAERRGRRVRRRRYTAGAVAACAVAVGVGVLTLPGLGDDGGRARPVAASVSPSPRPLHVDASVLTGPAERRLVAERLKLLSWAAAQKRQVVPLPVDLGGVSSPSAMAAFADVVVTGTVEGFTTGQARLPMPARPSGAAPEKALKSVVMQVRVDKTLKGSAPGPRVYVRVGSGDADAARFQAAIPAGARLVAFLQQVPAPLGDGGDGTGHPAGTPLMDQQQGLVFEDAGPAGTTLVGGPYLQAKYLGKPWVEATTVDRLATLLQTVKDDCTALGDRLAALKSKLRDQQAADPSGRAVARILVDQRARCGKLAIVRPRPPAAATPTP